MERTVLHCDCNCFFASVEMIAHPEYKKLPMAVCGSTAERHGIVLAKNDIAKKCGVKTGEVIWEAKKRCPGLIIAEPHYKLYEEYSREARKIYLDYTDMVEPFGSDECWLDVTASRGLFGDGKTIADDIRERMKRELGITVSAGVSFNKTFAKLGSDYKKPDATTVITRDGYKSILYPLPISDMMYIGRHTVPKMKLIGINTIGDLANADKSVLTDIFGKKGAELYEAANGNDMSEVISAPPPAKSYGNGMTFIKDICGDGFAAAAAFLTDKASSRMRCDNAECRTVGITIRDTRLVSFTRRRKLLRPTSSSSVIYNTAFELIRESWNIYVPARSLTVTCADIIHGGEWEQLCFEMNRDEEKEKNLEKLDRTVDGLRKKFGNGIITRAGIIGTDLLN